MNRGGRVEWVVLPTGRRGAVEPGTGEICGRRRGDCGDKNRKKTKTQKGKQTKNPEVALVAKIGSVTLPMDS